jgi:hypothetical protein
MGVAQMLASHTKKFEKQMVEKTSELEKHVKDLIGEIEILKKEAL